MQSLFEIKQPLPFDADVFDRMKNMAENILQSAEKNQSTQAIVLLSSKGRQHGAIIKDALSDDKIDEKALFDRLTMEKDTEIKRILCVWEDGNIDIPSIAVRNMLCALNPSNAECGLFVMTPDGYSVIKMQNTIK